MHSENRPDLSAAIGDLEDHLGSEGTQNDRQHLRRDRRGDKKHGKNLRRKGLAYAGAGVIALGAADVALRAVTDKIPGIERSARRSQEPIMEGIAKTQAQNHAPEGPSERVVRTEGNTAPPEGYVAVSTPPIDAEGNPIEGEPILMPSEQDRIVAIGPDGQEYQMTIVHPDGSPPYLELMNTAPDPTGRTLHGTLLKANYGRAEEAPPYGVPPYVLVELSENEPPYAYPVIESTDENGYPIS